MYVCVRVCEVGWEWHKWHIEEAAVGGIWSEKGLVIVGVCAYVSHVPVIYCR